MGISEQWLNRKVEYTINGYVGTCTAVTIYNNGNISLLIEGIDSTGRPIEWWINEKYAKWLTGED